jgi:hypothetical protein
MAPAVAGAAALLFALDHTHGFAVGYIMNRHALIATVLGALTLANHFRSRSIGRGGHVAQPCAVWYRTVC